MTLPDQNASQGPAPSIKEEWLICAIEHRDRLVSLGQEVNDMRGAISQIGPLHQRIEDITARNSSLQAENESLRDALSQLGRIQQEMEQISTIDNRIQKKVEGTSATNSRLQKKVEEISASYNRLQKENGALQERVADLEHQNNQQDQINNAKSQVQHCCEDKIQDLSSEFKGMIRVVEGIHTNTCAWNQEHLEKLEELKAQMGPGQERSGASVHINGRLGGQELAQNNASRKLCW